MTPNRQYKSGFSLAEMVVALTITTIAVAAATSGWLFLVRGEKVNSSQTELDIDVRKSMENIKHDLRLTSLDKIFYYPPGPGPYTAISIPMASDTNNDGLAEQGPGGTNLLWTSTIIYHVWNGSPNELRKTVFFPRDNSLTAAQFQEQLNSVVTNGNGSQTYGAANATTRAIFKNLFTWVVWGSSSTFDGYSSTVERDTDISFGSIYLGPGTHQVKFKVIGKNSASSGYKVGVDTLTATACGVEREGEAQLPPATQAGATAVAEYMTQGSWSGNYQLSFPAAGSNSSFTLNIDNDRWEETNFRGQGALCNRTTVFFDSNLSPQDYVVRLDGCPGYSSSDPYAWTAANQTGSNPVSMVDNSLTGCVVRVLLRGLAQAQNNGNIRCSGSFPYVFFQSSAAQDLYISSAYIAEASTPSNYTMNAAATGTQLYFGGTSASTNIPAGRTVFACPSGLFPTDANKSYLVSFVPGHINGCAMTWSESHADTPGSYVLPASANPSAIDAAAADWSSRPYLATSTLFAVSALYSTYPSNGLFTSQIFDTKIGTPIYSNLSWNAYTPANTSVKIKVRTGTNPDMSDASDWTNITAFTSPPAAITCGNKRYVQFQAILDPDLNTTYKGSHSPELKDVTIKWAGQTKIVDVSATMTKGPNYGICEVTVDDLPLTKGLRIDLTIFKNIVGWGTSGKLMTSSMSTEVAPRNSGK